MAGNKGINYGEYAFIGGLVIAVIVGVLSGFVPAGLMPILLALLFVFGLAVGLLNIQEKEVNSFLLATVALLAAATALDASLGKALPVVGESGSSLVVSLVDGFTSALMVFIAPAAFVVAIKSIYKLAQAD